MEWLVPWHPAPNATSSDATSQELRRELCSKHILFDIPVVQLGYRQDCDDALFQLLDGSGRVALVHLTFAQHPETDPTWPETRMFDSLEQFVRDEMLPKHHAWIA